MSVFTSRWVLALFLLFLLPLPVWQQQLAWLPVVEQWRHVWIAFSLPVALHSAGNFGLCFLIAFVYGVISSGWPLKIRGAVVGIAALSLIIIVSTWSLYLPILSTDREFLELRQIYVSNG